MNAALRIAWLVACLSILLLVASLLGSGTGLFGIRVLAHPMWSYVVLVAAAALILAFTPPRKHLEEAPAWPR